MIDQEKIAIKYKDSRYKGEVVTADLNVFSIKTDLRFASNKYFILAASKNPALSIAPIIEAKYKDPLAPEFDQIFV